MCVVENCLADFLLSHAQRRNAEVHVVACAIGKRQLRPHSCRLAVLLRRHMESGWSVP